MNFTVTDQESKIINYLKNKSEVHWEELAQFGKDPTKVKLKTIKRAVSEIKRKFTSANLPVPFDTKFNTLVPSKVIKSEKSEQKPEIQNLVKVKVTPAGNVIRQSDNITSAQTDFELLLARKAVKTTEGIFNLNDNEWLAMKYFHANSGKLIGISELRDKVYFHNYGSKLPPRWFDAIMRSINFLRKQVPNLDKRLLTVKGKETSYLFQ